MPAVGRTRINGEEIMARFPKGTLRRIDSLVDKGKKENRSSIIRDAVEREIKRREAQREKRGSKSS